MGATCGFVGGDVTVVGRMNQTSGKKTVCLY